MGHVEFQKQIKVNQAWFPQDIDTEDKVSAPFSMSDAHHAAVLFDVGTLAANVTLSILQGLESEAIVAVTTGGAGSASFGVAGDRSAIYTAGQLLVVSGSTGNDGIYTVKAGGSSYSGGVTTIPVDEAVSDGTVDGLITLVKAITGKTVTLGTTTDEQVSILEVEGSELDVNNGFMNIVARAVAAGSGGYIGAIVHRFPLRWEPASLIT